MLTRKPFLSTFNQPCVVWAGPERCPFKAKTSAERKLVRGVSKAALASAEERNRAFPYLVSSPRAPWMPSVLHAASCDVSLLRAFLMLS